MTHSQVVVTSVIAVPEVPTSVMMLVGLVIVIVVCKIKKRK